jgi:hypothetical protein
MCSPNELSRQFQNLKLLQREREKKKEIDLDLEAVFLSLALDIIGLGVF